MNPHPLYRRWSANSLSGSRGCRGHYAAPRSKPTLLAADAKLFAWLLAPAAPARPALVPATVRVRPR